MTVVYDEANPLHFFGGLLLIQNGIAKQDSKRNACKLKGASHRQTVMEFQPRKGDPNFAYCVFCNIVTVLRTLELLLENCWLKAVS